MTGWEQEEPKQQTEPILQLTLAPSAKGPPDMDKATAAQGECTITFLAVPLCSFLLTFLCRRRTAPHHHWVEVTATRTLCEIWMPFSEEKTSPKALGVAKQQEDRLRGAEEPQHRCRERNSGSRAQAEPKRNLSQSTSSTGQRRPLPASNYNQIQSHNSL